MDEAISVPRARVQTGDGVAALHLAELLRERGDIDGANEVLLARVEGGDGTLAPELARLLREQGDIAELNRRADAG